MTSLIDFYFLERSKFVKEHGYGEKTVLLMQVGSFYEILDKNEPDQEHISEGGGARKISQVLNIILTKKNKSIEDSPYMCGFPCVSLNKYLPILISNGYTVLKYDQVSETKRELTNIFSPSTPPDSFEMEYDPILMSIYIGDTLTIGVSIANTATGDIEIGEFTSSDMINLLICRQPSEIILNGTKTKTIDELLDFITHKGITYHNFIDKKLETIKEYSKASIQEEYIKKIYGTDVNPGLLGYIVSFDLEHFSQTGNILSLMFLFDFLYAHNPRFLESPQIPKSCLTKHNFLHLESNTIEQLHIFEGSRNVFSIINHTQTTVGKRHLRWVLSNPFTDTTELNNRYSLATKFLNLSDQDRNTIKKCLCEIKDIQTLQRSLICGRLSFLKFSLLHSSYKSIVSLCEKMEKLISSSAPFKSNLIEFIDEYSNCIKIDDKDSFEENELKPRIPFVTGFDVKIDKISNQIKESFDKLINLEKQLSKKAPVKLIISEERYIFTTTNIRAELLKKEKDLFFSSNKSGTKIWSDLTESLSQQIYENKKLLNDLVNSKWSSLQKEWGSKNKDLFDKLVSFVGLIDVTYSNSISTKRFNYCCPKIDIPDDQNCSFLNAKNLRHPIIERLLEYIPNDICIGKDGDSLGKIIYSLNSGGKSSLLRSVGISIILAQAGLFVPASEFSFFPFNKLISQVDFTDNLFNSRSSFVTEMLGLKSILTESDQNTLVLADELCKGSEINSATAIFASSICFLLSKKVKFLMSTHLHTVSKLPQIENFVNLGTLQICNLKVRIDPKDNSIVFLRKLESGPCDTLYGLEIAKALGLNKTVITDAFQIRNGLVGQGDTLLKNKRSKYNKNKLMDSCEICGYSPIDPKKDLPLDCHHISFQCNATESGFCGNKGKNHIKIHSVDNLVCLCKSCHQKVHCGEINIKGYIVSTNGKKLEFNCV